MISFFFYDAIAVWLATVYNLSESQARETEYRMEKKIPEEAILTVPFDSMQPIKDPI